MSKKNWEDMEDSEDFPLSFATERGEIDLTPDEDISLAIRAALFGEVVDVDARAYDRLVVEDLFDDPEEEPLGEEDLKDLNEWAAKCDRLQKQYEKKRDIWYANNVKPRLPTMEIKKGKPR